MTDASSEPDLLDRLAHEYAERCRRGERPALSEYADRHPDLAAEIRELFPALAVMEALGSAGGSGPAVRVAEPPRQLGEYRILREVGRGGMGVVYEAVQESLGRHVALKVLPDRAGIRGNALERFKREARAAANLHHTNIVPVFGVGEAEGVHYYAMQFIPGQGLDAVLDELRRLRDKTPRPAAAANSVMTVTLAANLASGRFPAPAADPVAPADPTAATRSGPVRAGSTVLSGSSDLAGGPAAGYFRTVARLGAQVADALEYAHRQGVIHRDVKPSNLLLDAHGTLWVTDFGLAQVEGAGDLTSPGDVVGTVRYMAPERFAGTADARSDVYGLALTLYELLTLRPGFDDPDRLRLIDRIRAEDPPRPRALDPRVPRDLELIVRKAAARHPDDRYESAGAFALDLQRYLNDEPVQACRPSAAYRFRKFARRNKGHLAAAAALGLALLAIVGAVGGTIGWAAREAANRRADAEARAAEALDEAEPRLRAGNPRDPRLVAAAGRAESQLAGGLLPPERSRQVQELLADLKMLDRLEEIRLLEADQWKNGIGMVGADPAYERAFREYGVDVDALAPREAGERLRSRSIAVHLASGLDSWARARRNRTRKAEDWARLLEVAWTCDPDPWRASFRQALARNVPGEELRNLARDAMARELPPATFLTLSSVIRDQGAVPLTVEVLRSAQRQHPADFWINNELAFILAVQMRPPRPQEAVGYARAAVGIRPESPIARMVLGISLAKNGERDEAAASYRKALELDPKYPAARGGLRNVYREQGKRDEAVALVRRGVELDPRNPAAHCDLGEELRQQSKFEEALAAYRKALELDPNAAAHHGLGNALTDQGKLEEAVAAYRKALELDPRDAVAHANLGAALVRQGKLDEAMVSCRKAVELDPRYAIAHNNLGAVLARKGQVEEAIACYRRAIELDPKLALAHNNLGAVLRRKGQVEEAIACYRKAIELDPKHALAHTNLGFALEPQGKLDEAVACYRKAIELNPAYVLAHNNLGVVLSRQGKLDEAIACFRRAVELNPGYARAYSNLGIFLRDQRKLDEAVACLKRAIELDPKDADAYVSLGDALKDHQKRGEAIAAYRKAIELKPDDAPAHNGLGNALTDQGKLDEAVTCLKRAIELDPKYVPAHYNLGNALLDQKKLEEAVASYRKAVELDPKYAWAHNNLGNALRRQGKVDEAAASFRRALELDPKDAVACSNVGVALLDQKRLGEAAAAFRKAVELDPKLAVAHSNLGIALTMQGKLDEAVACHRAAIRLDPNRGSFHHRLANTLGKQNKSEEAIAAYRAAVDCCRADLERDPKDATASNHLAWLLATCPEPTVRDAARAVELGRRAVELDPENGAHWGTLGVAQYRAGDWEAARTALHKAMERRNGGDSFSWFFLAMIHWRLGNEDEARTWYDRAVAWMDKNKPDDEELRRFRAEAAELMGPQGPVERGPPPRLKP